MSQTMFEKQNKKPSVQELIKKHFTQFELSYDGMEFDGSKVMGKGTKKITPTDAFNFLKEVNEYYPFSIKETTITEVLDTDNDTGIYLQRYFLGAGFRLYTE